MKNILLNKIKTVLGSKLRFSDPSVCWGKKSDDEKQCSSCIQSGPVKTYKHMKVSAVTDFGTVLHALYCRWIFVCVCAHAEKNNAVFPNNTQIFQAWSHTARTTPCLWWSLSRRSETY